MLLVSDTGSPGPEQLVVTTGLRGLCALEVRFMDLSGFAFRVFMVVYY